MIPVKSSLSPVSRRLRRMGRLFDGTTAGGEPDDEFERVLGVYEAEWMMLLSVVREVSDRARIGERRGKKLPGDPVAGPRCVEGESSDCEMVMELRSGETFLEEAAESELSGNSVNPNNLGRRPRFCAIRSESVAISSARRGGDRTSGKTCIGTGMPLDTDLLMPIRGLPLGLAPGEFRGDASREIERAGRPAKLSPRCSSRSGVGG
jgi:hypothetical protein